MDYNVSPRTSLGLVCQSAVSVEELSNVLPLLMRDLLPQRDFHATTVRDH